MSHMPWLVIPAILTPIIEIVVFIWTGSKLGVFPVLLLSILSTVIGILLVRSQGIEIWKKVQFSLYNRESPAESLLDGLCILIAGGLLIIPGFITDILGFLLLIPFIRKVIKALLVAFLMKWVANKKIITRKW